MGPKCSPPRNGRTGHLVVGAVWSTKRAAWWENLGGGLSVIYSCQWSLALSSNGPVMAPMTCAANRAPGSATVAFQPNMSVRPTLLGIPDELFVKILSSLDFRQLVRSQLVRYFRHSSMIRAPICDRYPNASTKPLDQPENYSMSLNWASVVCPMVLLSTHSTLSNGLITSSPGGWNGETLLSRRLP